MLEEEREQQNPDNEPEMIASEYINQINNLRENTVSREEYERKETTTESLQGLLSMAQGRIFRE